VQHLKYEYLIPGAAVNSIEAVRLRTLIPAFGALRGQPTPKQGNTGKFGRNTGVLDSGLVQILPRGGPMDSFLHDIRFALRIVAILAATAPALRAVRVDPMVALRAD
jgi:hypothetical protein